jgi:hypothetical protein
MPLLQCWPELDFGVQHGNSVRIGSLDACPSVAMWDSAAPGMVPSANVVVSDNSGEILMIRRSDNNNWALPHPPDSGRYCATIPHRLRWNSEPGCCEGTCSGWLPRRRMTRPYRGRAAMMTA